jgi:hypothetical protein
MTMASMPMVPYAYHDITLWHLRDAERVTPTHKTHPPPANFYPLYIFYANLST